MFRENLLEYSIPAPEDPLPKDMAATTVEFVKGRSQRTRGDRSAPSPSLLVCTCYLLRRCRSLALVARLLLTWGASSALAAEVPMKPPKSSRNLPPPTPDLTRKHLNSTMNQERPKTRRLACDSCHRGKTKCSGGTPCTFCEEGGRPCTYSEPSRLGRPRGSKNKRTLERRQAQEGADIRSDRSLQGLWLDIQNSIDLEQQHQLNHPLPTFEGTRDGTNTAPSIRTRSDTGSAASLLGNLPVAFFNPPNGEASSFDRRASQISNEEVGLPSSQLPLAGRSLPDGTSFGDLYGDLERPMSSTTSFNNYLATGLVMSATGSGYTFGPSQYPASLTPQHMPNFLDDVSVSPPDATDSSVTTTCDCLDKQVRLLFRMDKVEQAQKKSPPDVALQAARDAMEQWDSLRQCTACNKGGTEGVFLMFVMCMRFLLRALRCAFANTAVAGMANQQRSPVEDSAATYRSNWRVLIGKYEATGDEYKIASRMLIILAVRRIESALAYAKTRLQQRQATARLELEGDKGRAEAIEIFDRLIQEEKRALLTENEFDSYMGMLLHGLEGILGLS
ncbi:hypothetical protein P171DRAFT_472661 [Karstenula rhodostoma CBS 690.94]|uniref:Zn(2)-C6 fungal-type domain-containing protein n=1 Tax=Karstenula rhodostoma CBS 690.94 TaxID=1392251 RepID=A0A9P4PIH5_9PLEO|nr:hypothetical protein P171DRAFT_472661 [Karstenula rhodostoma CBS 690.94]